MTTREQQLEQELEAAKASNDIMLGRETYEVITKIADEGCTIAAVLGGRPCGKCVVCLVKNLEAKLRDRWVRINWYQSPTVESMLQALDAGVASHQQQKAASTMISALRKDHEKQGTASVFDALQFEIEKTLTK